MPADVSNYQKIRELGIMLKLDLLVPRYTHMCFYIDYIILTRVCDTQQYLSVYSQSSSF
jgi:hypothetical protein